MCVRRSAVSSNRNNDISVGSGSDKNYIISTESRNNNLSRKIMESSSSIISSSRTFNAESCNSNSNGGATASLTDLIHFLRTAIIQNQYNCSVHSVQCFLIT